MNPSIALDAFIHECTQAQSIELIAGFGRAMEATTTQVNTNKGMKAKLQRIVKTIVDAIRSACDFVSGLCRKLLQRLRIIPADTKVNGATDKWHSVYDIANKKNHELIILADDTKKLMNDVLRRNAADSVDDIESDADTLKDAVDEIKEDITTLRDRMQETAASNEPENGYTFKDFKGEITTLVKGLSDAASANKRVVEAFKDVGWVNNEDSDAPVKLRIHGKLIHTMNDITEGMTDIATIAGDFIKSLGQKHTTVIEDNSGVQLANP